MALYTIDRLEYCRRPLLIDFMVDSPLCPADGHAKVRACAVWGDDYPVPSTIAPASVPFSENVTLERLELQGVTGKNGSAASVLSNLQMYLEKKEPSDGDTILFATIPNEMTVGFFAGSGLESNRIAASVLERLIFHVRQTGTESTFLEQLCGTERSARETWGVMAAFGTILDLDAVQSAVHTWSQGACVVPPEADVKSRRDIARTVYTIEEDTVASQEPSSEMSTLDRRAECRTIKVNLYRIHVNPASLLSAPRALRTREYSTLRSWHNRLGHRNFRSVGAMMNLSVPCKLPICTACLQGKMKADSHSPVL
ncbi:hypothetical protein BDW59DRAFT_54073 [Aspergillus cavernicola]|uniref:GAG-pre-integrase domain-containing protein n=1 Tax=Aspergillus cavernicola TaxID=176166 RepID=A0ABR4IJW7_9EURO